MNKTGMYESRTIVGTCLDNFGVRRRTTRDSSHDEDFACIGTQGGGTSRTETKSDQLMYNAIAYKKKITIFPDRPLDQGGTRGSTRIRGS